MKKVVFYGLGFLCLIMAMGEVTVVSIRAYTRKINAVVFVADDTYYYTGKAKKPWTKSLADAVRFNKKNITEELWDDISNSYFDTMDIGPEVNIETRRAY